MTTSVNMRRPVRQRVLWLDYAKAIGIFFVVWGHAIFAAPSYASASADRMVRHLIYAFHMPLFFMASGIGLWYKLRDAEDPDIRQEMKKLARRLLLPYIFWSFLYLIANLLAAWLRNGDTCHTFLDGAYAILTGRMSPLWFLYTLFMAEALFLWLRHPGKPAAQKSSVLKAGGGYCWSWRRRPLLRTACIKR